MKKKSERNFEKPCIYAFTHSVFPSKTIPDSRQKWAKSILVFRPNGAKTPPDREAHTYIAYIRENPPPREFSLHEGTLFGTQQQRTVFLTLRLIPTDAVLPTHVNARKYNIGKITSAELKREVERGSNFYAYQGPLMHCLYFFANVYFTHVLT